MIYVTLSGALGGNCNNCLGGLMLHEMIHKAGSPGEEAPCACEKKCFPECWNAEGCESKEWGVGHPVNACDCK